MPGYESLKDYLKYIENEINKQSDIEVHIDLREIIKTPIDFRPGSDHSLSMDIFKCRTELQSLKGKVPHAMCTMRLTPTVFNMFKKICGEHPTMVELNSRSLANVIIKFPICGECECETVFRVKLYDGYKETVAFCMTDGTMCQIVFNSCNDSVYTIVSDGFEILFSNRTKVCYIKTKTINEDEIKHYEVNFKLVPPIALDIKLSFSTFDKLRKFFGAHVYSTDDDNYVMQHVSAFWLDNYSTVSEPDFIDGDVEFRLFEKDAYIITDTTTFANYMLVFNNCATIEDMLRKIDGPFANLSSIDLFFKLH